MIRVMQKKLKSSKLLKFQAFRVLSNFIYSQVILSNFTWFYPDFSEKRWKNLPRSWAGWKSRGLFIFYRYAIFVLSKLLVICDIADIDMSFH